MEDVLLTFYDERPAVVLLLSFCLFALLACVPFLPIPLVVGLLATQFEWYVAFSISVAGNVVGSIIMFLLMRRTLQNYAQRQLSKYTYGQRFSQQMKQHGFLAVLIGRLIPIMPSAAINSIAGVTGVSLLAFCSATFLGKLPNLLIYSIAGSEAKNHPLFIAIVMGLYVGGLTIIGRMMKRNYSSV